MFPELFQCPYQESYIREFAKKDEGKTLEMLKGLAKSGAYIIGGSFAEQRSDGIYNTSYVLDHQGEVIAQHDKNYLYTYDVPGKPMYDEADVFMPGKGFTTFDTKDGTFGLAICFDIRFPQHFEEMAMKGAKMIFLPGAFHYKVAQAHWELVL